MDHVCRVNNVAINAVKLSKCLDFETLLWKTRSLHSETKRQVRKQVTQKKIYFRKTASFLVNKSQIIAVYVGQPNFAPGEVVVSA